MELRGKREICRHLKRSWKTVMAMRDRQEFPVAKIGEIWVSDSEEIRVWRAQQLRRRG